jgi:hypothetical protein
MGRRGIICAAKIFWKDGQSWAVAHVCGEIWAVRISIQRLEFCRFKNPILTDSVFFLFSFFGEISPNFDQKNMISTYAKDFP